MKRIILVDGNNLVFRSYYATAYNGNFMKNSKGFPTNAIYGFVNMINKIINEEKPEYMLVAFDKGKTFRHEKYQEYKAGRIETPDELKKQMPLAKEILTYMGIKYYEIDNYEADDIIGTFARYCVLDKDVIGTIVSSDHDLLQLISNEVDIKLLKQKDYIRYNPESFYDEYKIEPIKIIDLKALQGDSSDNIPGVKGIGEKTALKLLQTYNSLDGVYENIDKITGKLKEKLITDKANAYLSYELATVNQDVPLPINLADIKIAQGDSDKLRSLYEELEFYSLLKKETAVTLSISYEVIEDINKLKIDNGTIYFEMDETNYHQATVRGISLYDGNKGYYLPFDVFLENSAFILAKVTATYDLKKMIAILKWNNVNFNKTLFDIMIAAYLLDYNVKDDIAYLANQFNYSIAFHEHIYPKKGFDEKKMMDNAVLKAKFIYDLKEELEAKLVKEELYDLFYDIELPLALVLAKMEYNGVHVDTKALKEMGEEIKLKVDLVSNDIYNMAGEVFNISSPSQLGNILFEKLNLPHGKKGKTGYSTAIDVLNKLQGKHPIIEAVMEYRTMTKLYTTYIEGLLNTVKSDGKIHTIYTQTLTRTGRLSSIEPNLQNIPIRYEYGRLIRKAFVPSANSLIISSDYSQIELRILAHMAGVEALVNAFKDGMDIHTKTAMDIFKASKEEITPDKRRIAKAVNFGIIYGISGYGLSENLDIPFKEAKKFIDDYLDTYPGIKEYMEKIISEAYQNGSVRTLFNRKRNIPELENKNYMIRQQGERIALNTPIQGTSADIIKKAMIAIDETFNKESIKSKMILQVHDELVFDVLETEKDKVIAIIEEKMEQICTLNVPLKVDIEWGKNWYQAK
ncbi:MAG: DNA polymerase I [Bacilli bacterium]|nr:DNA polymerase I [Bacilli bacterium]